jgi:hypothetical protein
VTDIGLYVPQSVNPDSSLTSGWYWLVSQGTPVVGTINTLQHAFNPSPFSNDLYFSFGNGVNMPLVGHWDPPLTVAQAGTQVTSLAPPILLGPLGTTTALQPTFTWQPEAGADNYDLWVEDLTTGASPVLRLQGLPGTSSSYTAMNLVAGHNYEWWLRAYDNENDTSPWSNGATFTLSPTPQLLYPEGPTSNLQPVFQWSAVPGASDYELWVSDLTAGTAPLIDNQNITGTTLMPATPLLPGHTYQWWVRALDATNTAYPWSSGDTFTEAPVPTPITLGPKGSGSDSPTFTWSAVAGADHYELWIDDLNTGQRVLDSQNVATTSATVTVTTGDSYQWWVRAFDVNGNASAWTSGDSFQAVSRPAPTPVSPAGPVTSLEPTLTWTAGSGADHLELWLSDLTTGQVVVDANTLAGSSTSWTPSTPLPPNHQFEWWLRSFDAQNQAGPWSNGLTFSSDATPILLAPSGAIDSLQPALTWTAIPGADHYEVYLSDLNSGQIIDQKNVAAATFTPASPLNSGHSYQWWVRTWDNHGNASPWSGSLTFQAGGAAVPVPIGPEGTGSPTPTFTWNPAAGADHYELYVSDLNTGQVIDNANVPGTSAALALSLGDGYEWWVRSISSSGAAGTWSSGATFRAVGLPAPLLLGPAGPVASLQPTLNWLAVSTADHYDVWVNDVTTGQSQVVRNTNVNGTSFTPGSPLIYGHTYRFWVRSIDAQGDASDWSLSLDFVVA